MRFVFVLRSLTGIMCLLSKAKTIRYSHRHLTLAMAPRRDGLAAATVVMRLWLLALGFESELFRVCGLKFCDEILTPARDDGRVDEVEVAQGTVPPLARDDGITC